MKYIVLIMTAILIACGGSQESEYRIPQTVEKYVRDIPTETFQDATESVGEWSLTVRHMGQYPYALENSAFSGDGYYFSRIDSHDRQFSAVTGGGPHSILTRYADDELQPLVFSGAYKWSFEGTGVAQLSAFMYLKEGGTSAAIVLNLKDSRMSTYEPYVSHDTFTRFLSAPPGETKFASTSLLDGVFTVAISAAQWSAIRDALQMTNPKITSYGVTHEIFYTQDQEVLTEVRIDSFKITRF